MVVHELRNGAKLYQLFLLGACASIGVQALQDTPDHHSVYTKLGAVIKRPTRCLDK
jgi:hypothetical protein